MLATAATQIPTPIIILGIFAIAIGILGFGGWVITTRRDSRNALSCETNSFVSSMKERKKR